MIRPHNIHWDELFKDKIYPSKQWQDLVAFLDKKRKDDPFTVFPYELSVFKALDYVPPHKVSVVIVGEEPYFKKGLATGLAFSVGLMVKDLPPTLKNIQKAVKLDTGHVMKSGDLVDWTMQGVLLLNSVLTVEEGKPKSHEKKGWEFITDRIVEYLSESAIPKVFMLWGKKAQEKRRLIKNPEHLVLETSHPSPQSVHRGFMFCRHFSQANQYLNEKNRMPIDWSTS